MTRTRHSLLSPATLFPSRLLAVSHVVHCSYTLHYPAFVLAMSVLFILYIDLPSHYVTLSTTCIIAYVPSRSRPSLSQYADTPGRTSNYILATSTRTQLVQRACIVVVFALRVSLQRRAK